MAEIARFIVLILTEKKLEKQRDYVLYYLS